MIARTQTIQSSQLPIASDWETNTPKEAPSLLPLPSASNELAACGDPGAQIAGMLLKASQEGRDVARKMKEATRKAEDAAEDGKIDDMRSAADKRFLAGIASGGSGIVGGITSIGGGLCKDESTAKIVGGAGQVAGGNGSVFSAFWNDRAADADVRKEQDERLVKEAAHDYDAAVDGDKEAKELANKVLELFRAYTSSKDDARRALIVRA